MWLFSIISYNFPIIIIIIIIITFFLADHTEWVEFYILLDI